MEGSTVVDEVCDVRKQEIRNSLEWMAFSLSKGEMCRLSFSSGW